MMGRVTATLLVYVSLLFLVAHGAVSFATDGNAAQTLWKPAITGVGEYVTELGDSM